MGYYVQTPGQNHNKAQFIASNYGGVIVPQPNSFDDAGEDVAIICVVDNGAFEAAGFAFDEREFEQFAENDGRPKTWVLMDRKKAQELTGQKD